MNIVKILHSGEGRDVEQWLEPETNSLVFAIDFFLLFIVLHSYTCDTICLVSILHSFYLLVFSVYTHINKEAIKHLNT